MTWQGDIYWKVGTTLRLTFDYAANTGNGKVQANFTIQIAKGTAGNQASTGLVITEIDATNNKGAYDVTVNATTGFVAATGKYNLRIYETADTTKSWEWDINVTSDGTGAGTTGAASFTATANDGRVTDGASALTGATVRIRDSSNAIITSFTSDSSGLWGPVYLSTGTYTIDVQKSGYAASTSKTITVSGSTATGPLTDVAISAATSGTGLTNSTLIAYGRRIMLDKMGAKADTELQQSINDALDMLSMERLWPFFATYGELALNGAYETGTITVTNASTTVTLASGTWPAWAASGKIKLNGKTYRIATRSSGSVVLLTDAFQEATASGNTYVLFRDEYSLPSDCMRIGKLFPGANWGLPQMPAGIEQILEAQGINNYGSDYPMMWGVRQLKLVFWPYPRVDKDLPFLYYRKPAALASANDEADWDPMQIVVLRRAIDYQISLRYPTVAGDAKETWAAYQVALARAVPNDKSPMHRPAILAGMTGSRRHDPLVVPPAS